MFESRSAAGWVVDRRELLKTASLGLMWMAVGPRLAHAAEVLGFEIAQVPRFDLVADEAMVQTVEGRWAYMWTWADGNDGTPRFPGPVLVVEQDAEVEVSVRNDLDEPHSFFIPGVIDSGPIAPGASVELTFDAPDPGLYAYYDSLNAPVNRVLGLHGAFMVMPPEGSLTPYRSPPPNVRRLFEDFGTTENFPGEPWRHERTWVWVFSNIDPRFNDMAHAGVTIDPALMEAEFIASYFTINGRSGFFSAHDPATTLTGKIGQPALVRAVNFGMHSHFPHAHANHKWVIAQNGEPLEDVMNIDTAIVLPLDTLDFIFPFMRPHDIPLAAWPPQEESFPFEYPIHCHNEPSQTARGSNYPQGLVAESVFEGDDTDHTHATGGRDA